MTTKENLDNIYYDYAKQQDFEVCILTKDEEKTLSSKWVKYSQLCFEDDPKNDFKISKVNNRSILNNEIVIDLENPELYSGCIDSLERDGLYYTCYKTGSKGYHFHLLFNKELTTKEKETMIAKYGGDMQKAISRCMIALENCPHWKTGIAKTMVVNKKGTNNYGKYFDVALKMPVEAITSPTIEDSKKTIITLMSKFSPVPYAQMLFQNTEFIYDRRKQFWRYDSSEGIWRTDAEQFIRTELRKTLMGDEQQKKSYTDEVVSYIKDLSYKENFEFKKNPYIIAFKNVLFDLEKDTIISFAPSHYITNKLDIEFGKTTECPEIDKFFVDCLDNEHKEILYDIAAYTLFTDYPYQKLFFIYGPPCTGKSQYLKLLETFIGKQNCSMVEPRAIQTDKHSMYKMWLKLANIVSDINYDEFENVNQIKKLTGGDSVDIRPMYQEGFSETLFAKQIYSTNKLPAVKEKTMAWYRRLYLVNFVNVVTNDKKDQFLIDKLVTKEELEGFAWQCLQRLRRLYSNKFIFTYDMDETKLPALYEKLSNPILMFIDESNHEGRDDWCFKYEFEERLNNWLKIHHFPPMTKSQINQYMKEHYTESVRDAPDYSGGTFGGKSYRVWVGLRWKSSEDLANLPTLPILRGFQNSSYMYNSFEKVVRTVKSVRNSPKQQFKALECITFMDIDGKEVTLEKDHIYNIDIINSNSFKILLDSKKVELEVYK